MNNRADFFKSRIALYKKDITLFAREQFQFIADDWQIKVFDDVPKYPRISVKSGQGAGKSAATAIIVLWFLSCFPYARIVATAPTKQQLNDVLWSEVSKWQEKSPVLKKILKWTKTYIYMKGYEKRWFAVARTATKPENMQGFHEDNMLFVVDEASGVADPIMEAILGTLSGDNNKLLMLGNPTRTSGTFFDSHTSDRALYRCHTVNCENVKRANKDNIANLKRKYGENSNVVRVRVYGEFPLQEDDVFIPLSLIEKSIMTDYDDTEQIYQIDIGCDVARFGDDKTVIGYRIGRKAEIYKKFHGQDTMKTAKIVAQLGMELADKHPNIRCIPIKVDDGGVGGGVVDKLRELKKDYPKRYAWMMIVPVHFGMPIKHKYYADTTTYMMSVLRELISDVDEDGNEKEVELILPNDSDLVGQLSCRKYDFKGNGKQYVESKDAMKDRGLTSPDEADCMLLVCLPVNTKNFRRKEKINE